MYALHVSEPGRFSDRRAPDGASAKSSVREPGRRWKDMTKDERGEAIMSTRYPPPDAPSAEEVAELLTGTKVARRSGGGGTLMTEPIVVVHGEHLGYFKLFDQDGSQLGSAVPVGRTRASASRALRTHQFRDAHDRCVFNLQDVGPRLGGWLTKWAYEISAPGGSGMISVKRVHRSTANASITEGPRQIGMMRPPDRSRVALAFRWIGWGGKESPLGIEDDTGRQVARVHIARVRRTRRICDLVVEVEDGTSEQLRRVALAASLIAESELINWGEGGG
jgi:hypothetical protein